MGHLSANLPPYGMSPPFPIPVNFPPCLCEDCLGLQKCRPILIWPSTTRISHLWRNNLKFQICPQPPSQDNMLREYFMACPDDLCFQGTSHPISHTGLSAASHGVYWPGTPDLTTDSVAWSRQKSHFATGDGSFSHTLPTPRPEE